MCHSLDSRVTKVSLLHPYAMSRMVVVLHSNEALHVQSLERESCIGVHRGPVLVESRHPIA